jgi:hypothetical protein
MSKVNDLFSRIDEIQSPAKRPSKAVKDDDVPSESEEDVEIKKLLK